MSSDEIRAGLAASAPTGLDPAQVDGWIFEERDRRVFALLTEGRHAIAESTNVTRAARARLMAVARDVGVSVTVLRFDVGQDDLLRQHAERDRSDVSAAEIREYAAIMASDAGVDQLYSEGAAAVHDVPGRRQGFTPDMAAAGFVFC